MEKAWDAIVVGAGVFGLSVAFALVRAGRRVLVLDSAQPGAGASGGPVGALAPHAPEPWSAKKAFQRDALLGAEPWWREVAKAGGVDPGFRRLGRLMPLRSAAERARAEQRAAAAVHWPEWARWQVLEPAAAAPWMAVEACQAGAVRESLTACIAPRRALEALVRAVGAGGSAVRRGAVVASVSPGEACLADGTRLRAGAVVVAAGMGTERLLAPMLGPDVVRGVKGQALLLAGTVPEGTPVVGGEGLWVVPHADGRVAVGSTSEGTWEVEAPDERLDALLERARELCPWLAGAEVVERWAGVRPRGRGPEPLVGELAPGLVVATAGFKTGWALAPVVAELVRRIVLGETVVVPLGVAIPPRLVGGGSI